MQAPSCGGRHGRGPGVVALGEEAASVQDRDSVWSAFRGQEKVAGHIRGVCDLGQQGGDATGPPP